MSRSVHGIAIDPINDEIAIMNPFAEAILFFRGGASGEEAPVRIIQGPSTYLSRQFGGLDRIAVDPVNNEVFVPGRGGILVFSTRANGDVAPLRVLMGPKTQMAIASPEAVAVDPENDLLVVTTRSTKSLLLFDRTAEGDTPPKRVISGPKSGLQFPQGIALYPEGKKIFVSVTDGERDGAEQTPGFVGVWNYSDNGDVAPLAIITGPNSTIIRPRGVAINPAEREIYIVDMVQNALLTFSLPEAF